jgi:four helix bundle protein
MRRAAISIPANIAEGFKKRGPSDKTRFLNFAQSSLEECRYYLILVQDLGYAATTNMEALLEEVPGEACRRVGVLAYRRSGKTAFRHRY